MSEAKIVLSAKDATAAAFAKAQGNLQAIQASALKVTAAFGLLGVATAAAFSAADGFKQAIETLDRLDDLAEKSGIAVEQLSALRFAGETAGTSVEDLAGGLRKLAANMADAAGGGKATGAAFEAIGVSVKSAEGGLRSSNEVLLEIADRFRSYQDGAGKSALATQIFGKAGEQLIPLLNQGSAGIEAQTKLARELGAVYSGDLAKSAADFNDNLKRLSLASEGAKVQLLGSLLPALNSSIETFIRARIEGRLLEEAFSRIRNVLSGKATLDFIADDDVTKATKNLAKIQGAVASAEEQIKTLESRQGDGSITRGSLQRLTELRNEVIALKSDAMQAQGAVSLLANYKPRSSADRPVTKTAAPVADKTGGVARDASLSEFQALLDKIKERTAADTQQLNIGRQLTEAEKFALDIDVQLTGAKTKLSGAQKDVVRARLEDVKALDRQLETRNLLRAAADADFKAEQETLDLIAQQTDARLQENRSLFEQLEIFGKSSREIENLRTKRLELALAVEKGAIAEAEATGAGAAELIALRDKAALLQQQIDLRNKLTGAANQAEDDPLAGASKALQDYAKEVSESGVSTYRFVKDSLRSLEDGLTDGITGKGFDAKKIVDNILAEFLRLKVVQPLISEIFGDGKKNSGLFGLALSFFGGGKAAGGPVSAGTPYLVGERGRELFVPQQAGSIVPNSALGGGAAVFDFSGQVINVGQGVSRAEVAAALNASNRQVKADILRSKRRAGAFE